jgi:hypothetical protein
MKLLEPELKDRELPKAREPFQFYDRLHLAELTGLRAINLHEFLQLLKIVPESCIYYHTHQFLQQMQEMIPEPANDFAWWVSEVLGDSELGERLSSIDSMQFPTLESLRQNLAAVIEEHLNKRPTAKMRFAEDAKIFYFIKSVVFIFPTKYVATDLKEFTDALRAVSLDTLYFHVFEARLRLEKETNDFSQWIKTSLGDAALADKISRLDPYAYSLEDLRNAIIGIIKWKLYRQAP